jgi:hypothetical protein
MHLVATNMHHAYPEEQTRLMPKKSTVKRAATAKKAGKAPSTQAGEYVREQMDKLKKGSPRVANRKQAIAIGLSEARKEGVKVPTAPKKSTAAKKSSTKKVASKKSASTKKATKKS